MDQQSPGNSQSSAVTKPLDQNLEILLKDYELAESRLDHLEARLIQLIGVGLPLLTAAATLLVTQKIIDAPALAWLSPSFLIVFYALIVYVLYYKVAYVHYCRILADEISTQQSTKALFRYKGEPPYVFFSIRFRRGKSGFSLAQALFCFLYFIFLVVAIGVYLWTINQAAVVISEADPKLPDPWGPDLLKCVYWAAGILAVISLIGASIVLPRELEKKHPSRTP